MRLILQKKKNSRNIIRVMTEAVSGSLVDARSNRKHFFSRATVKYFFAILKGNRNHTGSLKPDRLSKLQTSKRRKQFIRQNSKKHFAKPIKNLDLPSLSSLAPISSSSNLRQGQLGFHMACPICC